MGLSLWLDYHLWGLNPLPAHLVSIFLHVVNSLLVTQLALQLQRGEAQRGLFGPVAAGLLFLVLGCHAEAVSWISSRGDVLAAFFMLLMLVSCCTAIQRGGLRWWTGSFVCLVLALLSKESAFAAPLLILACVVLLRGDSESLRARRGVVLALAFLLAVVAAYVLFRKWMLGSFVGGYGTHGHLRLPPDLVAQSLGHFLWRIFLPPMSPWALEQLPDLKGSGALAFLALAVVVIAFLVWRCRRRVGLSAFCAFAFLAALAPVFNVRIYLESIEGERYLYLASVFAALGAGYAIARIRNRRLRGGILVIFALLQASILVSGVWCWKGAATIAQAVVGGIQEQHNGGSILLVNKPDAYGGALVFRTGLPEALKYFGDHPITNPEATVLFAAGLSEWDHHFRFGRAPEGSPGAMMLEATDGSSGFSEEDRDDLIETREKSRNKAIFRFRAPLHDMELFYYDSLAVIAAGPDGPDAISAATP
jgi:hypothetical protein